MTSATRVICQLMVSIMTSTPITVVTEVMICVRLWLSVWLTVSTSLVTRESTSPWLVPSKYSQRHAVDLFGDVLAEAVGDLHRHAGHDPALDVAEHGRDQVQEPSVNRMMWPM